MAGGTSFPGDLKPVRANNEVMKVTCYFTIGATGAHTLAAGTGMSVARTAAGKYTITFTRSGPILLNCTCNPWGAVDTERPIVTPTVAGFTRATASADATLLVEAWDVDETATQIELASGTGITYEATFLKTT